MQFYDYIRIIKPPAIRYVKNISLLIAFGCIITTLVVLAAPATQNINTKTPASGGGGCYGTKPQMEQAKKDYILRRFISYYEPVTNSLK